MIHPKIQNAVAALTTAFAADHQENDSRLNDASRAVVGAFAEVYGRCYVGSVNDRQNPLRVLHDGEFVFNFSADFVVPAYNAELFYMLVDRHVMNLPDQDNELDNIFDKIKSLGGEILVWS